MQRDLWVIELAIHFEESWEVLHRGGAQPAACIRVPVFALHFYVVRCRLASINDRRLCLERRGRVRTSDSGRDLNLGLDLDLDLDLNWSLSLNLSVVGLIGGKNT